MWHYYNLGLIQGHMIMLKITLVAVLMSFMASVSYADDHRNVALLASSCAACHGTNGHSVGGTPSLAGLEPLHFIEQMKQFVDASRKSTVMFHHASGLTENEVELLAEYFSRQ